MGLYKNVIMYKIEREEKGMCSLNYNEIRNPKNNNIRIKIFYNPNEKYGFDFARKKFHDEYTRLIDNKRLYNGEW